MVERLTGKPAFEALARDGRRARRGPVTVTWVARDPGDGGRARIAYTVGRRAGGAVVRNRIRRRLRAVVQEAAASADLVPGWYLIGAGQPAATLPYTELRATVIDAIRAASSQGGRG